MACAHTRLLSTLFAHSTHFCYTPLFYDATLLTPLHAMVASADAVQAPDGTAHAHEPHRHHLHQRLRSGGKGLAERARRLLSGVGLTAARARNATSRSLVSQATSNASASTGGAGSLGVDVGVRGTLSTVIERIPSSTPLEGVPGTLKRCSLVRTFFTRAGVLALGALLYVVYTYVRMRLRYDKRNFFEVVAMFLNLCAHQFVGGVLLLLYSMQQEGLDPIAWYSASFDFEFAFTMLYIHLVRTHAAPQVFAACREFTGGAILVLGQVGDSEAPFKWRFFYLQAFVSVGVVGVSARVLSICTIALIQLEHLPWAHANPVQRLAAFYAYLPLSCAGEALMALYIKPALIDALTFTLSDWLLSTDKSKARLLV